MDPAENIAYYIVKNLGQDVDQLCLVVSDQSITRKAFHRKVTTATDLLRRNGFSIGDRVLITIFPSIEYYVLTVAVWAIGGISVLIDPSMGLERCNYCIAKANPKVWINKEGSRLKYLKYILPSFQKIPVHLDVGNLDISNNSQDLFTPEEVEPVENALATFTTGSTGMPKLMMRSHSFVVNQTKSISVLIAAFEEKTGRKEKDSVFCTNLNVFPLHFLKVGALSVIFPDIDNLNSSEALDIIAKHSVTYLFGSPTFMKKLAQQASNDKIKLPTVMAMIGGAPVYKKVVQTVCSVVPCSDVVVAYGATEAEPISFVFAGEKMDLEKDDKEGHCVGKPFFSGTVKVIKISQGPIKKPVDLFQDYELKPYEIGEILLSGWHVNTALASSDRLITDISGTVWLRIEDAGYLDEDGRVWLVGRVKWMVERKGRRFWSAIVEQKLLDRCSLITFATYLSHEGEAWLFLEAPDGLPVKEQAEIQSYLSREGIPVDHMKIMRHIPKDRRHRSKPDTNALFRRSNPSSPVKIVQFFLRSNPLLSAIFILICCIVVCVIINICH